jgi:hypothetical protein
VGAFDKYDIRMISTVFVGNVQVSYGVHIHKLLELISAFQSNAFSLLAAVNAGCPLAVLVQTRFRPQTLRCWTLQLLCAVVAMRVQTFNVDRIQT